MAGADLTEPLAAIVGASHVSRRATGHREHVVRPGAASEIAEVLRLASSRGAAVVPQGSASRKQDVPATPRPIIVLEMKRMAHVLHLDETSLLVHAQAGLTGLMLEEMLVPRGLTIGDFTPAVLRSTLGGILSVRTPGKWSPRHGSFEGAVMGLSAVLANGRTVHTRAAPRRATGPDLARALLGSEGVLGIITSAILRIHRRPEARLFDAYRFSSLESAVGVVWAALRADVRPSAARVYDAEEARAHLGPGLVADRDEAVLVFSLAGMQELCAVDHRMIGRLAAAAGGAALGPSPAEIWWKRRTGQSLSGIQPPAPSLEIAAAPSQLVAVVRAMAAAAQADHYRIRLHISRFADDGACAFVTLFNEDGPDPLGAAREPVEQAARDAGGFLVGQREIELAPVLRELKRQLDPDSVLNPGVLA